MNYEERMDCQLNQDPAKCLESPMERSLYEGLKTNGVVPIMQFKLGKYFLDLSFPDIKIAIEYDGEHHMDSVERIEKDNAREEEIKSIGWKVIRICRWTNFFKITTGFDTYQGNSTDEISRVLAMLIKSLRKELRDKNREEAEEKRRIELIEKLKDRSSKSL